MPKNIANKQNDECSTHDIHHKSGHMPPHSPLSHYNRILIYFKHFKNSENPLLLPVQMNAALFKIWTDKIFPYQYVVFFSFVCYNSINVKPEFRKKSLRTTDNMKLPAAIFFYSLHLQLLKNFPKEAYVLKKEQWVNKEEVIAYENQNFQLHY